MSLPCWPSTKSLSSPAVERIGAVAAENRVVARAAVDRDVDQRREVADRGDRVVAAVHVHDEVLGRADVERERRRIDAIEAHARAVRRDREDLGAVAGIHLHRIDVRAAFHEVGVVTGIPDHQVVAGLAVDLIVGVATRERVVAVAAEQEVEAARAVQRVVAGLAEQLIVAGAARDRVVAGTAEEVARPAARRSPGSA